MSEMVDRVAKALCSSFSNDQWDDLTPHWHHVYRTEARAAIEAMREPTEEMMSEHSQIQITGYRDMIDVALEAK